MARLDNAERQAIRRLGSAELTVEDTVALRRAVTVVDAARLSADYVSILASARTPKDADSVLARRNSTTVRRDLTIARTVLIELAIAITEDHILANQVGGQELADRVAQLRTELALPLDEQVDELDFG